MRALRLLLPLVCLAMLIPSCRAADGPRGPADAPTGVTFIATSDSHYDAFENEDRNERDRATIDRINAIAGVAWPEQLGGDAVNRPRGVVALGDLIDDGDRQIEGKNQTQPQWAFFVKDFGLDGTDGRLKYPAFETWGNHDGPPVGKERFGFSTQAHLKERNRIRLRKGLITNLSENGLHYSWDWDRVHLVQLGIYPADAQHPDIRYNRVWHDPQGALAFLKKDLQKNVGDSGRPVVVMAHCGFDTDWWHKDDWKAFYEAVRPYNVVAYLHGHSGTGLRTYKPQGAQGEPLTVINTGQTENGFFVIQVTRTRLRAAYHMKQAKRYRDADGVNHYEWDGTWSWRHVLDKDLAPRSAASEPPPSAASEPRPRGSGTAGVRQRLGLFNPGLLTQADEERLDGPIYRDGCFELPNKPGLGIELNEDVCRKHLAAGSGFFE